MGFFDFLHVPDINQGINEYKATPGALLLDVRTPQEFQEGNIPESKNIPLQVLANTQQIAESKETPIFVYCYSGSRSAQAVRIIEKMGYTKVKNIGGISSYAGKLRT